MTAMPPTAEVAIADHAIATLTVPGFVDFLAADGRGVWATNTDRVEKFMVGEAGPVATVAVPGACGAMDVAFGSLWVAGCRDGSIYRVDLAKQAVTAVIATGLADPSGELSIAAGAGSIWIASDVAGALARIDPATNEVTARIPILPGSYCAAFGFGSVWVSNSAIEGRAEGSVQRIDPTTERVIATIPTGPDPRFIGAGEGGVWTLNWADGSVTRVDPESNTSVNLPLGLLGGGGDIATGAGRVWVRGADTLLVALNAATSAVERVYGPPEGSGAVRVAGDLVWVTAHDTRTVWILPANA